MCWCVSCCLRPSLRSWTHDNAQEDHLRKGRKCIFNFTHISEDTVVGLSHADSFTLNFLLTSRVWSECMCVRVCVWECVVESHCGSCKCTFYWIVFEIIKRQKSFLRLQPVFVWTNVSLDLKVKTLLWCEDVVVKWESFCKVRMFL